MRTYTLDFIINVLGKSIEDIFSFDYEWENVTIGDTIIDKTYLQNNFIEYFRFIDIGMETYEKFTFFLRREWLKRIRVFNSLLKVQPSEIGLEEKTYKDLGSTNSNSKIDYSDTPNQPMTSTPSYLTNRTLGDDNSQYEKNVETSKNKNLKLMEMFDRVKDLIYKFYDEFNSLFTYGIVVKSTIIPVR